MISNFYHDRIELKHLRSFMAIARLLSFRRAAEQLGVAQPALSRQMNQLETALGCQLFNRDRQRTQLTAAGEHLRQELPALFDRIAALAEQTHRIASGHTVSLRIGYAAAAMSSFLPAVIRKLHKHLENCEFEFTEATSDRLIDAVLAGHLDTAFILYRPDNPLLNMIPIRAEQTGVVLPDDHPLTQQQAVTLKSLQDETLILFPRTMNPVMYDNIISACHDAGFSPMSVREVAPRSVAIGLVAAGVGIATISESLRHTCVSGTTYRPLAQPAPLIEFSCISRKESQGEWWQQLTALLREDRAGQR